MNIDRIRTQIRLRFPWFSVISNLLDWELDESIPTACTNGKWVKFNPNFMDQFSEAEQIFIALHEIIHIARKHPLIRGDRCPKLWNQATDYMINQTLVDEYGSKISMPEDGLLDSRFTGMTEQEIYRQLLDDQTNDQSSDQQSDDQQSDNCDNGQNGDDGDNQDDGQPDDDQDTDSDQDADQDRDGQDSDDSQDSDGQSDSGQSDDSQSDDSDQKGFGGMGDFVDAEEDLTPQEVDDLEKQIEQAVETAAQVAQMASKGSGGILESTAKGNRQPSVDWRKVLMRFITTQYPSFRAWRNVDRRMLAAGVAYPGQEKRSNAEIVMAFDTSYSMDRETIANLLAEAQSCFRQCELSKVHVIYFHGGVWQHDVYNRGDSFEVPAELSRGGTSFQAMLDYVDEKCSKAKAVIIGTDGYDSFPEKPSQAVLWAMTTTVNPPYGEVIRID